jgi:hypothetical protein
VDTISIQPDGHDFCAPRQMRFLCNQMDTNHNTAAKLPWCPWTIFAIFNGRLLLIWDRGQKVFILVTQRIESAFSLSRFTQKCLINIENCFCSKSVRYSVSEKKGLLFCEWKKKGPILGAEKRVIYSGSVIFYAVSGYFPTLQQPSRMDTSRSRNLDMCGCVTLFRSALPGFWGPWQDLGRYSSDW